MPSALELIHNGAKKVRRPCWNEQAFLEAHGIWVTLHDPVSYAALEEGAKRDGTTPPQFPYVFSVFLIPWEEEDFEVVE